MEIQFLPDVQSLARNLLRLILQFRRKLRPCGRRRYNIWYTYIYIFYGGKRCFVSFGNWRPISFWFAQIAGIMTKQIQLMCSYLIWVPMLWLNQEPSRGPARRCWSRDAIMFEDSEPQKKVQNGPWRWKWSAESISVWPQNTCKTAGSLNQSHVSQDTPNSDGQSVASTQPQFGCSAVPPI